MYIFMKLIVCVNYPSYKAYKLLKPTSKLSCITISHAWASFSGGQGDMSHPLFVRGDNIYNVPRPPFEDVRCRDSVVERSTRNPRVAGSDAFVSLGKMLNTQLPHSTQVYK